MSTVGRRNFSRQAGVVILLKPRNGNPLHKPYVRIVGAAVSKGRTDTRSLDSAIQWAVVARVGTVSILMKTGSSVCTDRFSREARPFHL